MLLRIAGVFIWLIPKMVEWYGDDLQRDRVDKHGDPNKLPVVEGELCVSIWSMASNTSDWRGYGFYKEGRVASTKSLQTSTCPFAEI